MNKYFNIAIIVVVILFLTSCNRVDLNNKNEIKDYLEKYTFEYVDYSANMTSFMQFDNNTCKLTIYLNGELFGVKKYDYSLGDFDYDNVRINIKDNEGNWEIRKDGNLYLVNRGEIFVYLYKDI